uniref:Uncharacterized protein n=1 Tax=Arundo donax TaxID=35708 RepID=A0A0A9AVS0_ARUDO
MRLFKSMLTSWCYYIITTLETITTQRDE